MTPGGKPQSVNLTVNSRPVIARGEAAAGVQWVDDNYEEGHPKRYGAVCDGVIDDTAAWQLAINVLSNIYKVLYFKEALHSIVGKLYFHYDVTNNPGYNSDESKRGRWGMIGSGVVTKANMANGHTIGTVLESNVSSGIPFISEPLAGDATLVPVRGIVLENILFKANTADWVMKLDGLSEGTLTRLRFQNDNNGGSGLYLRDSDQINVLNIRCVGGSSYTSGTVGFQMDMVDLDSSNSSYDDILCDSFETSHMIGGAPTSFDIAAYHKFSRLRSNNVDIGGIIGDRVRGCTFLDCQFRGEYYGLKLRGRQESNTFIGGGIGANLNSGTNAVADLEIGDSAAGTGSNIIRNARFIGVLWTNIYATGVEWFGQSNITDIKFEGCRMVGADAAAKIFNFNGAPQGGRIIDLDLSGTYASLYSGTDHKGTLDEWWDETLGTQTLLATSINPNGGDIASATTIDIGGAGQVRLTGSTSINSIQTDGVNPPVGRKVTLHFNGSISLLSTVGGGTGTGNIGIYSGDFAGVTNRVIELEYTAGSRWRLIG